MTCAFCSAEVAVINGDLAEHLNSTSVLCFGSGNPVPIGKFEFTDEDLEVLQNRTNERGKSKRLHDQLLALAHKPEAEKWDALIEELRGPDECEHGRSVMGTCFGCSELSRKLRVLYGQEIEEDDE